MSQHILVAGQPAPAPAPPPRGGHLTRWLVAHRGMVVLAWLVLVAGAVAVNAVAGGSTTSTERLPATEAARAGELLAAHFPGRSAETVDVVWRAPAGVQDPAVRAALRPLLDEAARLPGFAGVDSPYADPPAGDVSPDGTVAVASLRLSVAADAVPPATGERLVELADRSGRSGLEVAVTGDVIDQVSETENSAEIIGLGVAGLVLVLSFGSLVAAGLPIVTALVGLGLGTAGTGLVAAVVDVPDFAPTIAVMIGIGVGVDYALLMVTRFRAERAGGHDPAGAVLVTMATAGRSVFTAGTTVVVAMLGLLAIGVSTLSGVAYATSVSVLAVLAASLTLLPALLAGRVGRWIDRLPVRVARRLTEPSDDPPAARWSRAVQRRPRVAALVATAVLLLLAAPMFGLRLGLPDAGNSPDGTHPRRAYDMVTAGFGAGANGPLVLVGETAAGTAERVAPTLAAQLRDVDGVAAVSDAVPSADGRAVALVVVPTDSPQSARTADLVDRLRADVLPELGARTGVRFQLGGATAANADLSDYVAGRAPYFIGAVILLSVLLLTIAFRAPLIALKAAAMNLLSVGAAYGAVAVLAEGGTLGGLIGIDRETPVPAFIPVLMFAALFGLSMDYEVFLLSRIREEYDRTRDTARAITEGLAGTARVITVAAVIMTSVFLAFVTDYDVFVKLAGAGLAVAVAVDATVIRLVLVPALMQLMGRWNWWLPRWLDRALPHAPAGRPARLRH